MLRILKSICCALVFILPTLNAAAQMKTVIVYDLFNGTVDSITNISYDTTVTSASTDFNVGTYNSNIEFLDETPPTNNVYPSSNYTYKQRAADFFDISNYPIRTSVKIARIENDTLKRNCSGSMISRKHVLSAAHCISIHNTDSLKYDSMYVCPVWNNGLAYPDFGCNAVEKIYFFKNWSFSGEDFAVFELANPIGEETGWLSVGYEEDDAALMQGIFYKFSYPAITFLPLDSNEYNGDTLYYNYGVMDIATPYYLGITGTSAQVGESGSSITKVENGQVYTTYGVLSFSSNCNHNRITDWTYAAILEIISDDLFIGVPELEKSIAVYPNPTSDYFRIDGILPNEISNAYLMDNSGRIVLQISPYDLNSGVNLSGIPNGMYHVMLETQTGTYSAKLVKCD